MSWENWPQANWHELNLDWLLKTVKDLAEKVSQDYADIYTAIAEGDAKTLAQAGENSKAYTDKGLKDLSDKLYKQLENDMNVFNTQIALLYNYIDSGDSENRHYIDLEILKIYKSLDDLLVDKQSKLYNPCRGELESAEKCVNDLYTYLAVHGVSAIDSDYFTDADIEKEKMTARFFDLYSKKKLRDVMNNTKMFSAYDGLVKTLWNEIGLNTLNSLSQSPENTFFDNIITDKIERTNVKEFDFNYGSGGGGRSAGYHEVELTNIPTGTRFEGVVEGKNGIMTINGVWYIDTTNDINANQLLGTLVGQTFRSYRITSLLTFGTYKADPYVIKINEDGSITTGSAIHSSSVASPKIYVSATVFI